MSVVAAGAHATDAHLATTEALLSPVGASLRLDEHHLDAVTALSGSGPAYVFLLAEAMTEAGVLLGLPRDVATDAGDPDHPRRADAAGRQRRRRGDVARRGDLAGRARPPRPCARSRPRGSARGGARRHRGRGRPQPRARVPRPAPPTPPPAARRGAGPGVPGWWEPCGPGTIVSLPSVPDHPRCPRASDGARPSPWKDAARGPPPCVRAPARRRVAGDGVHLARRRRRSTSRRSRAARWSRPSPRSPSSNPPAGSRVTAPVGGEITRAAGRGRRRGRGRRPDRRAVVRERRAADRPGRGRRRGRPTRSRVPARGAGPEGSTCRRSSGPSAGQLDATLPPLLDALDAAGGGHRGRRPARGRRGAGRPTPAGRTRRPPASCARPNSRPPASRGSDRRAGRGRRAQAAAAAAQRDQAELALEAAEGRGDDLIIVAPADGVVELGRPTGRRRARPGPRRAADQLGGGGRRLGGGDLPDVGGLLGGGGARARHAAGPVAEGVTLDDRPDHRDHLRPVGLHRAGRGRRDRHRRGGRRTRP